MNSVREIIESSIRSRLLEHGFVAIPGLGMLVLKDEGARIDFIADRILPPASRIHFLYSKELEDYILAHSISLVLKEPYSRAIDLLDEWVSGIHADAFDGQMVNLGALGHFYVHEGEIAFKQAKDALPGQGLGFRSVHAKPIKRIKIHDKADHPEKKTLVTHKPKGRFWARVLPWAAAFIILIPLSFLLYERSIGTGETSTSADSNLIFYQEERLNKDPQEVQQMYEGAVNEDPSLKETEDTLNTQMLSEEELDTLNYRELDDPDDTVSEESESGDRITTEPLPEAPSDGNCVIVVGAFSSQRYFNAMQDRVLSLGYEVFTDRYNGLNRVGVRTSCERKALMETLEFCRQEIDSSSWILN